MTLHRREGCTTLLMEQMMGTKVGKRLQLTVKSSTLARTRMYSSDSGDLCMMTCMPAGEQATRPNCIISVSEGRLLGRNLEYVI